MLVSASPDKSILIWDSKKSTPGQRLNGHKDKVYCARLNENDKLIASIGEGAELLIWDVAKTSQPIKRIDLLSFVGYDISWSNNGEFLFVTTKSNKVIALDSKTFSILDQNSLSSATDLKVEGVCANWKTLPNRVFCASEQGHISWYKFENKSFKKEIEFNAHASSCRSVNLHPHQKYLVSTGKDGSVRLWDCNHEGLPKIVSNLVGHDETVS